MRRLLPAAVACVVVVMSSPIAVATDELDNAIRPTEPITTEAEPGLLSPSDTSPTDSWPWATQPTEQEEPFVPSPCPARWGKGWLRRIDGYLVLHVEGTPEEMGEQHGVLLRNEVQRMIKDLIYEGEASYGDSYERLIQGAMVMERYQPEEYRREMKALAQAAGVKYEDVVAAQLFGDVWRGGGCTSFAFYGPATATGECIVGRNMDFWDHGVTQYGAIMLHVTPDRGYPFFTVTWAGIINGWTLMNIHGLVAANNSAYGGRSESLRGISTCFMLRKAVQNCANVQEAVRVVRWTPRACGTAMIVAGGKPPAAAMIEFDHAKVRVRWAEKGYVLGDNSFHALYVSPSAASDSSTSYTSSYYSYYSRYDTLEKLATHLYGKIDRTMPISKAPGVAISSMNLHTLMLYPTDLTFAVSMGKTPATSYPFHWYALGADGVRSAAHRIPGEPPADWLGKEEPRPVTTPTYTYTPSTTVWDEQYEDETESTAPEDESYWDTSRGPDYPGDTPDSFE